MNNQLASTLLSSTKLRSSELDFVRGGINHLDGVVSSFIFCGASRCTHRVGVHFSHVRFHGMYQAVCASFCFRCFGHAVGVGQHDTGCRSLSPNGASLRPNGAFRNSDGERFSPY